MMSYGNRNSVSSASTGGSNSVDDDERRSSRSSSRRESSQSHRHSSARASYLSNAASSSRHSLSSRSSSGRPSTSRRGEGVNDTIVVVAPATLEENFEFDVTLGGRHGNRPFTVTVPPGGVRKGEQFEIPFPTEASAMELQSVVSSETTEVSDPNINSSNSKTSSSSGDSPTESTAEEYQKKRKKKKQTAFATHRSRSSADLRQVDTGDGTTCFGAGDDEDASTDSSGAPFFRWRNKLCSCCDVLTQSTFWMALFCSPVLIAQLTTRLGLSFRGHSTLMGTSSTTPRSSNRTAFEDAREETSSSYNKIVLSFCFVLAVGNCLPGFGIILALIYVLILTLYVGSNIRRSVRQRYKIPPVLPCCRTRYDENSAAAHVEDYLCMTLCGCCSLVQMARHTHDDKEYPGYCCSTNGLGPSAPDLV